MVSMASDIKGKVISRLTGIMLPSKWENLSRCSTRLLHFWKKLVFALDCMQIKYSLQIFNMHIFSILCVPFVLPLLCCFQKLHFLVIKQIRNNYCCIVLLFVRVKKVCQIFKILLQTGDINIFVLHCVFFNR